ncbi:hypothetical protein GCM10020229_08930 [Kitasatospora albolonga]
MAGQQVTEPGQVLGEEGLVQPEAGADGRDRLGAGVRPGQAGGRVAGDQPEDGEIRKEAAASTSSPEGSRLSRKVRIRQAVR